MTQSQFIPLMVASRYLWKDVGVGVGEIKENGQASLADRLERLNSPGLRNCQAV